MKNLRPLSVILLAGLLVACGPTKKSDQGDNDSLGRTGQGQRGGNGGSPAPTPQTFQQYCDSLHGSISENICKYVWKKVTITLPANPPDIYRVRVAPVHEGMSVQAQGDPNNAGILYLSQNTKLTKLMEINEKVNRARITGVGDGDLVFISTANFTVPAEIKIFECRSPEKTLNNCQD